MVWDISLSPPPLPPWASGGGGCLTKGEAEFGRGCELFTCRVDDFSVEIHRFGFLYNRAKKKMAPNGVGIITVGV